MGQNDCRSGAEARALRETLGWSRGELAAGCLAEPGEVAAWEAGEAPVPGLAWEALDGGMDEVAAMLEAMRRRLGPGGRAVTLGYVRDDDEARSIGVPDVAEHYNARVRAVACALRASGVEVRFAHAGEVRG